MKVPWNGLFFLMVFFSVRLTVAAMPELPRSIPRTGFPYKWLPQLNSIDEIPIQRVQKAFMDHQLLFCFAIQNESWKGTFFVITPEFQDNKQVSHLIFNAINEERFFQAVILKDSSFIISFDVMQTLLDRIYNFSMAQKHFNRLNSIIFSQT